MIARSGPPAALALLLTLLATGCGGRSEPTTPATGRAPFAAAAEPICTRLETSFRATRSGGILRWSSDLGDLANAVDRAVAGLRALALPADSKRVRAAAFVRAMTRAGAQMPRLRRAIGRLPPIDPAFERAALARAVVSLQAVAATIEQRIRSADAAAQGYGLRRCGQLAEHIADTITGRLPDGFGGRRASRVALTSTDRRGARLRTGWRRVSIDTNGINSDSRPFVPALKAGVRDGAIHATGTAAVGCCDLAREAWSSRDGRRWREDRQDPSVALGGYSISGPQAFARRGLRRVAVGTRPRRAGAPLVFSSAAWYSDDGRRWRRVPGEARVFGDSSMDHVWTTPTGFVAFGVRYLARRGERQRPMVWTSRDGRSWRRDPRAAARLPRDSQAARRYPRAGPVMAQTRGAIVALTTNDAWLSRTGTTWTHAARLPGPRTRFTGDWRLHDTGDVLFAVRTVAVAGPDGTYREVMDVRRTTDGRHFETLGEVFGPHSNAEVTVITRIPSGWLAAVDHSARSKIWFSDDGRRFRRVARLDQIGDGHVYDIVHYGDQIVLVGGILLPPVNKPAYRATAWLHRLP